MKEIRKIVTILVGLLIFYVAYCFWFGSGIFNGFFATSVESGQLGAGPADGLSQLLELVATVITTVGTIGIFIATKLISYLAGPFESAVSEFAARKEPTVVTLGSNENNSGVLPNTEEFEVYLKVIAQAIIDGDAAVIESIANKIHGEKFIRVLQVAKEPELTPGGFPASEGGE